VLRTHHVRHDHRTCWVVSFHNDAIKNNLRIHLILSNTLLSLFDLILSWWWWCYPTPPERWGRVGILQRPEQSGHAQVLDQKSKMKEVVPKMACRKGSDAWQLRRNARRRYKKNSSVLSRINIEDKRKLWNVAAKFGQFTASYRRGRANSSEETEGIWQRSSPGGVVCAGTLSLHSQELVKLGSCLFVCVCVLFPRNGTLLFQNRRYC